MPSTKCHLTVDVNRLGGSIILTVENKKTGEPNYPDALFPITERAFKKLRKQHIRDKTIKISTDKRNGSITLLDCYGYHGLQNNTTLHYRLFQKSTAAARTAYRIFIPGIDPQEILDKLEELDRDKIPLVGALALCDIPLSERMVPPPLKEIAPKPTRKHPSRTASLLRRPTCNSNIDTIAEACKAALKEAKQTAGTKQPTNNTQDELAQLLANSSALFNGIPKTEPTTTNTQHSRRRRPSITSLQDLDRRTHAEQKAAARKAKQNSSANTRGTQRSTP